MGTAALGAAPEASRWEFAEVHMGMPVRLTFHAADEPSARSAARAAFDRVAALDRILSDYRPESELNAVNGRAGEWVPVSSDLLAVLARARRLAEVTGGAFDPTVGPLVELWREARRAGRLPDAGALDNARARVGWRHLELDPAQALVRLAQGGTRLDLGGIAKGFILDEALGQLRRAGVRRALIVAGGDIVAGDPPPGERGWRVEVPGAASSFAARAASLENAALATSGAASQFVEVDGVRYSHVVDPTTGVGITRDAVVHVIAPDGATADALATAIGVVGLDCARAIFAALPNVLAAETGQPGRGCGARGPSGSRRLPDPSAPR